MLYTLLFSLGISVGINLVMFLIAFKMRTDKLTDISYAVSFVALALFGLTYAPRLNAITLVLAGMTCVWAGRLGGFLLLRISQTGRDKRFDGVREDFWKFGKFWLGQAVSAWIVMLPTLLALKVNNPRFVMLSIIGLVIWATGLSTEATADYQKYQFAGNAANKNKWIDSGVWHYSRHPNYFGEICVWLGVYLFALPMLSGAALFVGLLSPLLIASLLLFVSGIPLLEKSADARWGKKAAYQKYKASTSVLIPLARQK